jgi:mannose-6-phosphate isomerase
VAALAPVLLPSNQFDHFYLGGDRIKALRGGPGGPRRPEDWIASATTRAGQAPQGLSRLPDGSLLRDRVAADPVAWLGAEHVARYGSKNVELLVKLLDAGQRLPVHVHPTRAWAREHLGLAHGKTEAWVVVDADPGAVVGLGLRTPMSHDELLGLVRAHDSAALVDAVHTRPVRPGDGVLVPAGTPHLIGEGVFVVEVQEPTDLSILLEWEGFAVDGDAEGHLGLGFPTAVTAVDTTVWSGSDVGACVRELPGDTAGLVPALVPAAEPYFRAEWISPGASVTVPPGFAVLVVLEGDGRVSTGDGDLGVHRGNVALVPHGAGRWELTGDVRGVLCRPPAPDAPPAPR